MTSARNREPRSGPLRNPLTNVRLQGVAAWRGSGSGRIWRHEPRSFEFEERSVMDSDGRAGERGARRGAHELRAKSRAGLKILIPGYVQWTWRQRERAAVLFGSFVM